MPAVIGTDARGRDTTRGVLVPRGGAIAVVVIVVAGLVVAGLWGLVATGVGPGAWDPVISAAVVHGRPAWLTRVAVVVSNGGGPAVMIGAVIALGVVVAVRTRGAGPLLLAGGGLLALSVADVGLKDLTARARPPVAGWAMVTHGYSFPSGHAVFSAGAVVMAWLVLTVWSRDEHRRPRRAPARRAVVVLAASSLVLAVGVSRVIAGVHYPTDVVAGWAVAVLAVGVVALSRRVIVLDRSRRNADDREAGCTR